MTNLFVDNRHVGNHGIARYAREVVPRLGLAWKSLGGFGSPTSVFDTINPSRMRLRRSDILYSPGFSGGLSCAKQVLTVHDLIHVRNPQGAKGLLHRAYYERVLRPLIVRSRHVITVSETTADDLRNWLGDDRVTVHNSGNGCSPAFRVTGPAHLSRRPYFLYVGNLKAHKNPAVIFGALAELPDWDLIVVTSDREQAFRLGAQAQVLDRILVFSGVDDDRLAELYRGALALLFPSIIEGFGLPVVEALNCGSKIIYFSGCRSVAELCGGREYEVTAADSSLAFAEAMRAAALSPKTQISTGGPHDWATVAESVSRVLKLVLEEHGG